MRSDIDVSLEAPEPAVTVLRYGVKANIGGKLAQLGSRMVDAAARKVADEFFAQFGSVVARKAESAPPPTAAATAPEQRNAMTYAMWRAIPGVMSALERNPEVGSIIR